MTGVIRFIHPSATGDNNIGYDVMFREQEGKCFLCHRTHPTPFESLEDYLIYREELAAIKYGRVEAIPIKARNVMGRYLVQDHDHATGIVRALLCPNCNGALGGFEYFIDRGWLDKVLLYLKRGAV